MLNKIWIVCLISLISLLGTSVYASDIEDGFLQYSWGGEIIEVFWIVNVG